jgi:hypothetical protein
MIDAPIDKALARLVSLQEYERVRATYPNFPNWRPDFGILSAKAESLQGAMRRKRM